MSRKRKSSHSHSKKSKLTEKDKTLKKQNDKSQEQYCEDTDDEILRKHKCKKSKPLHLNLMEGIILLLLLKENGILDELINMED